MADEATKFLEEKAEQLEVDLAEQEKKKKQKKKKGEEEPEIVPATYKYLPRDLLLKMLRKRLCEEDCNAGVIFDNLTSENWPNEKFGIEIICDAVPTQNIQIVLFGFNKEAHVEEGVELDAGEQESADKFEVATNYRYARRHNKAFQKEQPVEVV